MKRQCILLLALLALASTGALAQGKVISTFPYNQDFSWVSGSTTGFPTGSVSGAEFTNDAVTSATWATTITDAGLHNNGGGSIRIQTTAADPAQGFIWYGDFSANCPDSLSFDWSKVENPPNSTATSQIRVATNTGAGGTYVDIPLANVTGGAWPTVDNSATPQSGTLRVKLPASFGGSALARVRIYVVNTGGTGNHPRVVIDNLAVTALAAPTAGGIDSVGNAGTSTQTLFLNSGGTIGSDSLLVVRRTGAAPTSGPVSGTSYMAGQGLNGTDTVVFVGPTTTGSIRFTGLQQNTPYYYAVYRFRSCGTTYSTTPAMANASTLTCGAAPANVTNATNVMRSQDSLTFNFTTGGRTDSILVIRRLNQAPTATPTTGTRYTVGQGLNGTDTVAYFGPAGQNVTVRNLLADSLYRFTIYAFQSCNATYSATGAAYTARTYCIGTVGNVNDVTLRYTSAANAGLSITSVTGASGYIVFSNGPDTLRPAPVTGVPYTVGMVVGDDTVRYVGPSRQPVIQGLNPLTTYRFTAFGMRECNYAYSAIGDTVSGTTLGACAGGTPGRVDTIRVARNVTDTLTLSWRRVANATNYLVVARIDSSPTMGPVNGTFYQRGDSLGSNVFVLARTNDTSAVITGLPANTAYFVRVYAYRACDLTYGAASFLNALATRGTATSQRFAVRAGSMDTIRFAGAVVAFTSPLRNDGSLLITRQSGQMSLNGIPMFRQNDLPIDNLSTNRWWSFRQVGLDTVDADLAFDITGLPGIQDTSDLEVVFRTQPNLPWEDFITTGYRVDSTGHYLLAENRTFLSSEYAIGASGQRNTLPVNLLSFDGFSNGGRNILRWRTASEKDNAGFRLYRATAGDETFELVTDFASDGRLRGAGTSNLAHDYGYVDASNDLRAGKSYTYRLEEVSLDGSSNEVGRITLAMAGSRLAGGSALRIAPNPAAASTNVSYTLREDGPVTITLSDALGRTVRTVADEADAKAGSYSLRLDLAGLPAGLYFCRIMAGDDVLTQPLTVVR